MNVGEHIVQEIAPGSLLNQVENMLSNEVRIFQEEERQDRNDHDEDQVASYRQKLQAGAGKRRNHVVETLAQLLPDSSINWSFSELTISGAMGEGCSHLAISSGNRLASPFACSTMVEPI